MSEIVTLTTGGSGTIYGSLAAALAYVDTVVGAAFRAWESASPDAQKRSLLSATRYLDRQGWIAAAESFALRDVITAFQEAAYELAVLVTADEGALSTQGGSDIASISDNGGSVTFFGRTSPTPIPAPAHVLVGAYLASAAMSGPDGGYGLSGDSENPFASAADFDKTGPF